MSMTFAKWLRDYNERRWRAGYSIFDRIETKLLRKGWNGHRAESAQEIARLKHTLAEIYDLAYGWTMKEPLEIVAAGGAGHAAPMGQICQLVDAALEGKE